MSTEETNGIEADTSLAEHLNWDTFSQILEMDEPDDFEFSQSIVFGFFEQAETTFQDMDEAVVDKDLEKLSSLGHFLKGSSATIGLNKVRDHCEKIQRFGKKEKLDGSPEDDEDVCLSTIVDTIKAIKADIAAAQSLLQKYYDEKEKEAEGE